MYTNWQRLQGSCVHLERRRAYQRAIAIPTEAIDGLWRAYEGFEYAGPNKTLSRRLLEEQRPKYQQVTPVLL